MIQRKNYPQKDRYSFECLGSRTGNKRVYNYSGKGNDEQADNFIGWQGPLPFKIGESDGTKIDPCKKHRVSLST